MEIKGKTILLTGGTSGIGKELFTKLALNNILILVSRNASILDDHANDVHGYPCDLSKSEDVDQVARKITQRFPKIDILINNAAIQYTPKFIDPEFTLESVDRELTINFASICRLTHLLLPALLKESRSIILNINSGLALAPKTTSAVYCATKAALNSFSISLGYQLEETNIRVLQAFMPLVDTPMTQGRGRGKISASDAAQAVVNGLEAEKINIDVGKVRLLRLLLRIVPSIAFKIMKRG